MALAFRLASQIMHKRILLLFFFLLAAISGAKEQPNVVLVLVDDMREPLALKLEALTVAEGARALQGGLPAVWELWPR